MNALPYIKGEWDGGHIRLRLRGVLREEHEPATPALEAAVRGAGRIARLAICESRRGTPKLRLKAIDRIVFPGLEAGANHLSETQPALVSRHFPV
jgi:hypothetical protein